MKVSLPPGDHVPPASGVPPSWKRMLNGISSLHTVMLRLVHAFGAVTTVTTTFAEALGKVACRSPYTHTCPGQRCPE